jgi:hypothetical protein
MVRPAVTRKTVPSSTFLAVLNRAMDSRMPDVPPLVALDAMNAPKIVLVELIVNSATDDALPMKAKLS